jgi:bifunctional DNA-binding transcriptional regulator/antitoxin component of YhaV-PrlF toxin-antitoxin module
MAKEVRLGRVQQRGQVTIPIELRRKLGIEEGGVVASIERENGLLISPREVLAMDTLDPLGKILRERGISLEELIESGKEIRGEMVDEDRSSVSGASGQGERSTQHRQQLRSVRNPASSLRRSWASFLSPVCSSSSSARRLYSSARRSTCDRASRPSSISSTASTFAWGLPPSPYRSQKDGERSRA